MSELYSNLQHIHDRADEEKPGVVNNISQLLAKAGYDVVERNDQKPWGAYFRINGDQAEKFINEFFTGLTVDEARLGIEDAELSPKILLVSPAHRLSWQYHDRRAERWTFLTSGAYNKSLTDEPGELFAVEPGEVVQFAKGERHRLVANQDAYTVVAEIWQHSNPASPSNEDDIVRLADDYQR